MSTPHSRSPQKADDVSGFEQARDLLETGAEIVGAMTGGALGLIGGPVGVAAGAVGGVIVARTLRQVGAELSERMFGRQRERVGATYSVLASDIAQRLDLGELPRDDGFLTEDGSHNSPAARLLEGTLLAAANDYEERKTPYLGHFYANLVFSSISAADASFLLATAERLTFRQVVLLGIFGNEIMSPGLAAVRVGLESEVRRLRRIVAREINDLGDKGLLTGPRGSVGEKTDLLPILTEVRLTETGRTLSAALQLADMPEADQRQVLAEFAPSIQRCSD
jgi:hypothetical protein